MKGILILLICVLLISPAYSKPGSLATHLQQLYTDYFSSSLLWRSLAHNFNRSELVLPGFSQVFLEFSKLDQQHADRAMELTGVRGFKFSNRRMRTRSIITQAISNKETLLKNDRGKQVQKLKKLHPDCNMVKITLDEIKNMINPYLLGKPSITTVELPRAHFILRFAQMIQNCYMTINMNHYQKDPHLKYVILREFVTEQIHRGKLINDLIEKLEEGKGKGKGERWVEFVQDKVLRSMASLQC